MSSLRTLDVCVFCGGTDMTDEHLIAFWAHRAFAKQRKPTGSVRGTIREDGRLRLHDGDAELTAKIICRECNNGWVSRIDNAAAEAMRPLIRGERAVTLNREGQAAVAAWIYKTALTFDAAEHGADGSLRSLREGFKASRLAGPGCIIYAGPASRPPSVTVGDPPTNVNLWPLGIVPTKRNLRLTSTVVSADGGEQATNKTEIPIPGYRVMVGALWAYLGGQICPVDESALDGFSQIWPAREPPVTVRAASLVTSNAA
jgi:hypothetical protein